MSSTLYAYVLPDLKSFSIVYHQTRIQQPTVVVLRTSPVQNRVRQLPWTHTCSRVFPTARVVSTSYLAQACTGDQPFQGAKRYAKIQRNSKNTAAGIHEFVNGYGAVSCYSSPAVRGVRHFEAPSARSDSTKTTLQQSTSALGIFGIFRS